VAYRIPISRYRRYVRVYYSRVSPIFTVLKLVFFVVFSSNSLSHTMMQPNMAVPATCTLLLTFIIVHPCKVSYKTNSSFVCQALLTHNASGKHRKISIEISINMLIMLLQQVLVTCTGTINRREHKQGWVGTSEVRTREGGWVRAKYERGGRVRMMAGMNDGGHQMRGVQTREGG